MLIENCMCIAEARSEMGTVTPEKSWSPSRMFLNVTRSLLVSANPWMLTAIESGPLLDTLNEEIVMPSGRRAAMRKTTGDKGGNIADERAVTRSPAADRPDVMEAVSVAMPFFAD